MSLCALVLSSSLSIVHSLSLLTAALPQIKALANDPTHKKHFHLLELFAHGTYADFTQDPSKFPQYLREKDDMMQKLKMLTVVTMAASNKNLDYSYLMESLDLGDVRELEDLLIECIYAEIVVGRLDQQSSQLKVQRVVGRDPSDLDIANMCEKLERWNVTVDSMIIKVDDETKKANNNYEIAKIKKQALKDQIDSLKQEKQKEMASGGGGSTKQGGGVGGQSPGASGWTADDDMAAALAASRNEF